MFQVPILFSIECSPYSDSFAQSSAHLPLQYQSALFDSEHLKLNYLDLVEAGEKMTGLLDVTDQQCKHLEEITRGQAVSKIWVRYHCGRITASRLYEVIHTDPHKPAISLVTSICYPESEKFSTAATEYGRKHEKQAIAAYKLAATKKHNNLKITPAGLTLYGHKACFGASPDSMLECVCCGKGVLEVKCPYRLKESCLDEAETLNNFCLTRNCEGTSVLKQEHAYFYQCQMQMVVTHTTYCDFVVLSPSGIYHMERIVINKDFIEQKLQQAEKLFWLAVMPELLGKWYTRKHTELPSHVTQFTIR